MEDMTLNTYSKFESYDDKEDIEVVLQDKDGHVVNRLVKTIRTNIFQPNHVKESWLRKYLKMLLKMTESRERTYVKIHRWLKPYLFYPLLKLMKWIMKKDLIKSDDDIVKEWYNNNIRVFRHCFHESVDDIWRIMLYNGDKKRKETYANGQEYLETFKNNVKDNQFHPLFARKLMCDFWVTEMLWDTVDREWCNFFMCRSAIEVCRMYDINPEEIKKIPRPGQFPMYLSDKAHNPMYFRNNVMAPVWLHPNERGKDRDMKEQEMLKPKVNHSIKPEPLGNIVPDADNYKLIGGNRKNKKTVGVKRTK